MLNNTWLGGLLLQSAKFAGLGGGSEAIATPEGDLSPNSSILGSLVEIPPLEVH